jgi:hypothetical protein
VLISQLTSKNITDNNENLTGNTPVVSTTQSSFSNFNPATPYSLPPFSMTVFQWPNSTLPGTTTTLNATPTSGAIGQSIGLTASVSTQSGTNVATGIVTFMQAGTSIGTATLNASGVATLNTTALAVGADSITAVYSGNSIYAGSASSAVTVEVASSSTNPSPATATTTTLATSATQVNPGQNVTATAKVVAQSGGSPPAGTVTFLYGTTAVGTAQLNSSGVATISGSASSPGSYLVTASYGGNASFSGSTSSPLTLTIGQSAPVATTITLTASAQKITTGQMLSVTAKVSPQSGRTVPTGTVTFLYGSTSVATATLDSTGAASMSGTVTATGVYPITASYSGNGNNTPSSSAVLTLVVD